jgi:hypothetical protein
MAGVDNYDGDALSECVDNLDAFGEIHYDSKTQIDVLSL